MNEVSNAHISPQTIMPPAQSDARSKKGSFTVPRYVVAALIVSVGGMLNGLDTGTIGPVTTMPAFEASFGKLSSGLRGFVVSSLLLPATFMSVFAGALSDSLGRSRAIALGALLFAVGAAMEAGAANLAMLVVGRCIVGLGEGAFLSTLVVYVCEIAPPSKRGPLAFTVQLFITIGLAVGYFACYGTVNIASSLSWRIPFAMQSAIAFFVAATSTFYLPQSPRWLAHKGRRAEASAAWDALGVSNAEREKDLLETPQPETETQTTPEVVEVPLLPARVVKKTFMDKLRANVADVGKLLSSSDARKPMVLGVFMMSMQQLSGIDGVIYYAPLLFQRAGLSSSESSFLASGVSAICILVFTVLAVALSDRWGRRPSTIYGGALLVVCMAIMALLYATNNVHASSGGGRWVVVSTIFVFAIGYSMTWALGLKLFASEIQPTASRATATSLAQAANCLTNFFVALITPVLLESSSSGIYFLFGGCSLLTVAVAALYMPETQGQDLDAVRDSFLAQSAADSALAKRMKAFAGLLRTWAAATAAACGRGRRRMVAEAKRARTRETGRRRRGVGEEGGGGGGGGGGRHGKATTGIQRSAADAQAAGIELAPVSITS